MSQLDSVRVCLQILEYISPTESIDELRKYTMHVHIDTIYPGETWRCFFITHQLEHAMVPCRIFNFVISQLNKAREPVM